MEAKINVAKILKYKPQGTKLHDLLRNIDVELDKVHTTDVGTYIKCTSTNEVGSTLLFDYSKLGTEDSWLEGLQILLPSKEMRDWSKFAWKKGDLLINSCGFQCIFKEWASDNYTKFNGCYSNSRDGYEDVSNAETAKFVKLDNNIAYGYVREIERKLGGKLNLETLEVENAQPEFKEGDIVSLEIRYIDSEDVIVEAYIVHGDYSYGENLNFYAGWSDNTTDKVVYNSFTRPDKTSVRKELLRYATEEEKQQLFDALAKEGKAWDADKKMIIDLKQKVELKPFDKVLVRDSQSDKWRVNLFGYIDKDEYYHCAFANWVYCIPYAGNEHLLGTTKDVEG